jgi:hypothetical protein
MSKTGKPIYQYGLLTHPTPTRHYHSHLTSGLLSHLLPIQIDPPHCRRWHHTSVTRVIQLSQVGAVEALHFKPKISPRISHLQLYHYQFGLVHNYLELLTQDMRTQRGFGRVRWWTSGRWGIRSRTSCYKIHESLDRLILYSSIFVLFYYTGSYANGSRMFFAHRGFLIAFLGNKPHMVHRMRSQI